MVYMDHDMVPSQKGYYPSSTLSHCTVNYSLSFLVYGYLMHLCLSLKYIFYFRGTVHFGPDSYFSYVKMNLNLRTNFPNSNMINSRNRTSFTLKTSKSFTKTYSKLYAIQVFRRS